MLRMTFLFDDTADEQKVVNRMHAEAEQVADDLDVDYELNVEIVDDDHNSGVPVDAFGLPLS